jgi:DNA-binding transcriptional ArsR family regulator
VAKILPPDAAKAVGHPVRVVILERLRGQLGSAKSIADELGLSQTAVAHHFKVLRELGAIEWTGEKRQTAAGRREHLHRALWRVRIEVKPVE